MIQNGAVPAWFRDYVLAHKDEIARALRKEGVSVIPGPNGEEVRIKADRRAVAA